MPYETATSPILGVADARSDPTTAAATVAGDTTVLAAPGAGLRHRFFRIYLGNNDAAKIIVRLQEAGAAVNFVEAPLAADGGGVILDFGAFGWTIAVNTALDVNLPAGGPFDVFINFLERAIVPA